MTSETQHDQPDVEEDGSDSMGTTLCLDDFRDSGHEDDYESDSDVSSEQPVSDREDFEEYNPCRPRPSH